ncbi:sigma-70 family RNA polymerase sigma factor [Nocardia sp. NPDC052001]|uniref:sigma-70 family RNA polymerase sigma factor n=1 Tax=Nocardia sp. NPDC052001 TaxID=3154853 RepID=UPI003416CEC2
MEDREEPASAGSANGSPASAAVKLELCRLFYLKHAPGLMMYLATQGASAADAEDVLSHTMSEVWVHWDRLTNPRAWAYQVARRALILRRKHIARESPTDFDPEAIISGALDISPSSHDLLCAMAQLPDRQLEVLGWRIAGFSPSEIAEELHLTPSNARANLTKARRSLEDQLKGGNDQP